MSLRREGDADAGFRFDDFEERQLRLFILVTFRSSKEKTPGFHMSLIAFPYPAICKRSLFIISLGQVPGFSGNPAQVEP